MSITDKTRKILWGRSGNRCAVCRRTLVVDANSSDQESVVGDECHLISGLPHGPRYDSGFPTYKLDELGNLILLCRVHHKMVDDQFETYTVDLLKGLKRKHEDWVASSLCDPPEVRQLRLRRIREHIPAMLIRLKSGSDVMKVISDSMAYSYDHDDLEDELEVDLVSGFLQEVQDWGDLSNELDAGERVRAAFRVNKLLMELQESGFVVFGGRETQRLEGGIGGTCSWPIAILRVLRTDNPSIMSLDPDIEYVSRQNGEEDTESPCSN